MLLTQAVAEIIRLQPNRAGNASTHHITQSRYYAWERLKSVLESVLGNVLGSVPGSA